MNGKIISKFIGLKPKSYCYKVYVEEKDHKKSKGIVKHKVSSELSYEKYADTLNRQLKETVKRNMLFQIMTTKDIGFQILKAYHMDTTAFVRCSSELRDTT